MTIGSPTSPIVLRRGRRRTGRWAALGAFGLAAAAAVGLVLTQTGVRLVGDSRSLARVDVQAFGGRLEAVTASDASGRRIPVAVAGGRITPRIPLAPGERVSIDAVVRRPGWLGWLLGDEHRQQLAVRTPVAQVRDRWLTVPAGQPVRVAFSEPVSAVAYRGRRRSGRERTTLTLPRISATGTVAVAAAARPWERLGTAVSVSWFPPAPTPVAAVHPLPGAAIAPGAPITLTFSKPLAEVLGSKRPTISPSTAGRWRERDPHTLVFTPTGVGIELGSQLSMSFPRAVAVAGIDGKTLRTTRRLTWNVPPVSPLRLQQLLADAGYLPLVWHPSGPAVARTPAAELRAAIDPPKGSFSWRYANTPPELRALWTEGAVNPITRGAVMMFQHDHGLTVDAIAGPNVWRALLADAIAGKRRSGGYSYVYVHSSVPQSLTLWHDGQTVLSSPGNTGVPAAPTQLGTFQVFEHIPVGTMSGTNPDGSHYHDPGIRYISYFNGGDAIHAFNRASFGTPQSLGCVELPLAAAARVWPYTPIGTLVTIEK